MKNKSSNVSKLTIVLSFIIITVVFLYNFISSDYFFTKNINIYGNKNIKTEEIKKTLGLENNKNIFMYNVFSMKEKLLENNYIKNAKISIKLPDTININIDERQSFAILTNEKDYYVIDEFGEIIEKIDEIKKDSYNVLVIHAEYDIIEGKMEYEDFENNEKIPFIIECIKSENLENKIKNIIINKNINIKTKDNLQITLSYNNISYNLSMISAILVDLQSQNKKGGFLDLTNGYALYKP